MSLRAKDHLEGTKVAVFPRYCAENKVQTGSAAAGGHRRVATRKTTGDLATRRGAGDPETRAEWTTVLRYGHLRSAPVVVDVGYTHGVGTAYAPCSPVALHALLKRLLDGLLPLRRSAHASAGPMCTSCRVLPDGSLDFATIDDTLRQVQKVARDADSRTRFLALAGCGGHCAAMIVQQSGSFIRVETELSGSFDLETCAFSLRFSGFWHLRLTAPDSLKGPLPWCECETKFRSSWRISVQFSGDSGLVSDGNSDTSWSSTYMPGRAVGVNALSCLHLCPREFAADTDESARKGNFAVLALHRGFWSHSARRRLDKCSNKLRGLSAESNWTSDLIWTLFTWGDDITERFAYSALCLVFEDFAFVGNYNQFHNEIDLAGSESLDGMEVDTVKPQKLF